MREIRAASPSEECLPGVIDYLGCLQSGSEIDLRQVAAWTEFFDQHDPIIKHYARACGIRGKDLEECVQDAWVTVLADLEHFKVDGRGGPFCAWLFRRVHRAAQRQLHDRAARREQTGVNDLLASLPSPDLEPHERDLETAKAARLERALDLLHTRVSKLNYTVFIMRKLYELPTREVAQELGLSEAHVRKRLSRCMGAFRGIMYSLSEGDPIRGEKPVLQA